MSQELRAQHDPKERSDTELRREVMPPKSLEKDLRRNVQERSCRIAALKKAQQKEEVGGRSPMPAFREIHSSS
jgi:hypothetical protein